MKSLISTKLITTNIGNQALSDELIFLAEERRMQVVGRPFGLDNYTTSSLSNDLINDFEGIAAKIAKLTISENKSLKPTSKKAVLLPFGGTTVKTEPLRVIFRKFRKLYFRFYAVSPAYRKRLALYSKVDNYYYSAAGEVSEQEFFYRQLLDLRIAQLKGVKTYAINQSVELPEGNYKTLLLHVYKNMENIVLRGEISKSLLVGGGVPEHKIILAPDSAFRTTVPLKPFKSAVKKVAINFTKKTYVESEVIPFLEQLMKENYELFYVTNDPYGDEHVAKLINQKLGINYSLETLTYKDYVQFLQDFDVVISSRLHTNELAFTGGIPVLPIEGNMHKTTEVFKLIDYPLYTVQYKSQSYGNDLSKAFEILKTNFNNIQKFIRERLPLIAEQTKLNIDA
ncbi:MAG TPA: polysaccharide pyruvyl transferase family protein [Cyclobacteriaceae bacterium]|nr:polysaccharide pyruvyl transferase family protein [Cyclobacteriaceae bacterium]